MMVSYTFTNYNGGKVLQPKNEMLTEEYLMNHGKLFMTEMLVKDSWGRTYHRYRLMSGEPMRFSSTLEYDIRSARRAVFPCYSVPLGLIISLSSV